MMEDLNFKEDIFCETKEILEFFRILRLGYILILSP
jgi:hypothetical protein